jgi:hypothetical protein
MDVNVLKSILVMEKVMVVVGGDDHISHILRFILECCREMQKFVSLLQG